MCTTLCGEVVASRNCRTVPTPPPDAHVEAASQFAGLLER